MYYDIGILWGVWFMLLIGIFVFENVMMLQGGDIECYMIFMIDGDIVIQVLDYSVYGIFWFDKWNVVNLINLMDSFNDEVNVCFVVLCMVVKNKNIMFWVILFGSGFNMIMESCLQVCVILSSYYFKVLNLVVL